jgi:hypothetical protein
VKHVLCFELFINIFIPKTKNKRQKKTFKFLFSPLKDINKQSKQKALVQTQKQFFFFFSKYHIQIFFSNKKTQKHINKRIYKFLEKFYKYISYIFYFQIYS